MFQFSENSMVASMSITKFEWIVAVCNYFYQFLAKYVLSACIRLGRVHIDYRKDLKQQYTMFRFSKNYVCFNSCHKTLEQSLVVYIKSFKCFAKYVLSTFSGLGRVDIDYKKNLKQL